MRTVHCQLCEAAHTEIALPAPISGTTVAAYAGQDMVVLLQPEMDGVLIAPGSHVTDLSQLEPSALGTFLGSLRRVALDVQAVFGSSGTMIEPVEQAVPAAGGHVCFHIVPSLHASRPVRSAPPDLMTQAERFAQRIG